LAAGVFGDEDILSNKKGCWQHGFFYKKNPALLRATNFSQKVS
jgi:hypothetical protein